MVRSTIPGGGYGGGVGTLEEGALLTTTMGGLQAEGREGADEVAGLLLDCGWCHTLAECCSHDTSLIDHENTKAIAQSKVER